MPAAPNALAAVDIVPKLAAVLWLAAARAIEALAADASAALAAADAAALLPIGLVAVALVTIAAFKALGELRSAPT